MAKYNSFDVIVAGGGLSGLSLTCLLAQRGMSVVCIDAANPDKKSPDLRTTAISYGSRKILEKAGIWEKITDACPIDSIEILDGSSPVLLDFNADEIEGRSFGWIVDNENLKAAMLARLNEIETAHHLPGVLIKDFAATPDTASAILANGETYIAKLLIGADGRGSALRAWMIGHGHIEKRECSYRQRAVICMVEHEHPHNNVAVEHFRPEGPFAILPFTDDTNGKHRSAVVFTEHGHEKTSRMHLGEREFEMALAARFPARYGDIKLAASRAAYPLGLVHASGYIAPRMALVADAAHGIHPIAGQGLNLGFRDLEAMEEIIGAAYDSGADIGAPEYLEAYQRRRRPDNMAMVAVTDGLNRLFSNNIPPVRLVRKIGLKAVSKIPPAKRFFMKQAMGDRG